MRGNWILPDNWIMQQNGDPSQGEDVTYSCLANCNNSSPNGLCEGLEIYVTDFGLSIGSADNFDHLRYNSPKSWANKEKEEMLTRWICNLPPIKGTRQQGYKNLPSLRDCTLH